MRGLFRGVHVSSSALKRRIEYRLGFYAVSSVKYEKFLIPIDVLEDSRFWLVVGRIILKPIEESKIVSSHAIDIVVRNSIMDLGSYVLPKKYFFFIRSGIRESPFGVVDSFMLGARIVYSIDDYIINGYGLNIGGVSAFHETMNKVGSALSSFVCLFHNLLFSEFLDTLYRVFLNKLLREKAIMDYEIQYETFCSEAKQRRDDR